MRHAVAAPEEFRDARWSYVPGTIVPRWGGDAIGRYENSMKEQLAALLKNLAMCR
jgi:hypothetical protein